MNIPLLMKFMTPGGFIKKRKHTGLCKTMQSRVARTIKQARTLGLFSYKGILGWTLSYPQGQTFTVKNPMITHLEEEDEDGDRDADGYSYEEFENENEDFDEKEYRKYLDSIDSRS